jgi:hypothetical protein
LPLTVIFGIPVLVALITIVGLVVALLDNGWLDVISWNALLVPLTVIVWALRFRRI